MDSSTEEILLQKIEELVMDEDKIVTNSILCEKFDVSMNHAKSILEKYVSDVSNTTGKVSVTYVLCGKLKSGEYCIQIVDSILLKERKKIFSCVSNEVVYSVQKSNTIDLNAIALAEKSDVVKTTATKGSIVGQKCIERSIKSKVLPPPPPQKIFEKQKPSSFFKPVVKTETNVEKKTTQSSSTNGTQNKSQSQKKTGGLASFLTQSSNNTNTENKMQPKKSVASDEDMRETKRPRLESNDFEKDKIVKQENDKGGSSEDTKPDILSNKDDSEEKANNESSKENKPSKKTSTKKKQDGKKRKRIIVESESEDDLFGNDEEEKMEVDSEEEKPVITQPTEIIPKNKRRKAVQNKYMDDDGFVVTKTEYVLVSASEDEETDVKEEKPIVKPVDKEEKKSPLQKVAAKGKKGKKLAANQTTLMNFFTKK